MRKAANYHVTWVKLQLIAERLLRLCDRWQVPSEGSPGTDLSLYIDQSAAPLEGYCEAGFPSFRSHS